MSLPVLSPIWRRLVRHASRSLLDRQTLTPEARTGRRGEEAAYWHLRERGFIMVDRNYRPPTTRGEIDLIGWDAGTLVFVEVKTRRSVEVRAPELDVDRNKELLIKAAAREYRQQRRCSASPFRFDVISVEISGKDFRIQHFQDAFR